MQSELQYSKMRHCTYMLQPVPPRFIRSAAGSESRLGVFQPRGGAAGAAGAAAAALNSSHANMLGTKY